MFFKECPLLNSLPLPAILQDILIVDKRCRQTNHYSAHDNFTARWWTNHHVSSSSTRKLDTGHWPMLAVVWAMSPAPKKPPLQVTISILWGASINFEKSILIPRTKSQKVFTCSLWSAVCHVTHTQLCIPRYLAFWFTEIAVPELVVDVMTANYQRFFSRVNADHHF